MFYSCNYLNMILRNIAEFPDLENTCAFRGILSAGECLFIPALWFHTTRARAFSVSINSFFKSLPNELYGKDLYGNRDPLPVEEAKRQIEKAKLLLDKLPDRYRDFYLNKLGFSYCILSPYFSE